MSSSLQLSWDTLYKTEVIFHIIDQVKISMENCEYIYIYPIKYMEEDIRNNSQLYVSWPVGQPVDTGLPKKNETAGTNAHLDPSVKMY